MTTIEDLIPKPPRTPNPIWSKRAGARFAKAAWVSAGLGILGLGLISLQFFVGTEVPIYSRIFIIVIAAGPLAACWLVWSNAAKERDEALAAWANWGLSGMKGDTGKVPSPVEASTVSLSEVLAGRDKDQYFVLVDPKFRFNRRRLDPDFLQELSEKPAER